MRPFWAVVARAVIDEDFYGDRDRGLRSYIVNPRRGLSGNKPRELQGYIRDVSEKYMALSRLDVWQLNYVFHRVGEDDLRPPQEAWARTGYSVSFDYDYDLLAAIGLASIDGIYRAGLRDHTTDAIELRRFLRGKAEVHRPEFSVTEEQSKALLSYLRTEGVVEALGVIEREGWEQPGGGVEGPTGDAQPESLCDRGAVLEGDFDPWWAQQLWAERCNFVEETKGEEVAAQYMRFLRLLPGDELLGEIEALFGERRSNTPADRRPSSGPTRASDTRDAA